jgi:hypothetical protein
LRTGSGKVGEQGNEDQSKVFRFHMTGFSLFSSSCDNDKMIRIVATMRATVP